MKWIAMALLVSSGCAHGIAGAYQAEANTTKSVDGALHAFEAFDHDYQLLIVSDDKKAGKTPEQIESDLQAYRGKRAAVNRAFADAGAALLAGAGRLPLVESGIKKQSDLNAWLVQLAQAAAEVQQALSLIGVLK